MTIRQKKKRVKAKIIKGMPLTKTELYWGQKYYGYDIEKIYEVVDTCTGVVAEQLGEAFKRIVEATMTTSSVLFSVAEHCSRLAVECDKSIAEFGEMARSDIYDNQA